MFGSNPEVGKLLGKINVGRKSLTNDTGRRFYEKDEKECKEKAVFTSQQTLYYTHKRTKMDHGQLYQFFHFLFDFPRYYHKSTDRPHLWNKLVSTFALLKLGNLRDLPNTRSIVPIIATASASKWPLATASKPPK